MQDSDNLIPALLDLGSAFFGACYFLLSAHNVKSLPICLLLLIMNCHTWMINSLMAKSVEPQIRLFSFDMQYGCLGFLNPNNDPWLIGAYALFASFFGSAGYVLCLLFFSPLVTSNAFLVEPFFAQVVGYSMGLDKMPGLVTFLATVSAITGIYYIEKGSRQRVREKREASDVKEEELTPDPANFVSRVLDGSAMVTNSALHSGDRISL